MKREEVWVTLLSGTAVVLVALIVLTASGRGPLLAETTDRSGGFVITSTAFDEGRDIVYVLDERSGQLATILFGRGRPIAGIRVVRDLRADLAIPLTPPPVPERPMKPER
jgi:hypothetical protein